MEESKWSQTEINTKTVLAASDSLGRYRLLTILGEGGMGRVYKAQDTRLDRIVALKVLPPEMTGKAELVQRFEREAKYSAKLRHSNIVALYDFETIANTYFLTMDFIDGVSLDRLIKEESLTIAKSCSIILEVLEAIGYAHSQGIIHRDLKPSNILIDRQGKAFVADFGLAKALNENLQLSQPGAILGTPSYMSPEQVQADETHLVNAQSDLYSLGAIFYEMLTGKKIVEGNSLINVFHRILNEEIPSSRKINPKIPVALDIVCQKALAKKQEARYGSAAQMATDIKKYLADQPVAPSFSPFVRLSSHALIQVAGLVAIIIGGGLLFKSLVLTPAIAPKEPALHKLPAAQTVAEPPTAWPIALWQTCWNVEKGWLDFTAETWMELTHTEQVQHAKSYQKWYAKKLSLPVEKNFPIGDGGMLMELIPPGKFWMGELHHRVVISKPFWLGKYEVTQRQWLKAMGNNPAAHFSRNRQAGFNAPVEQVSWFDCENFCQQTGYQLPTEAQWEYACRAGTTKDCHWGNREEIQQYVWYEANSDDTTHPVGEKKPNAWGLHDMAGNVWEWCRDYYGNYPTTEVDDPVGTDQAPYYVVRGGCFKANSEFCLSPTRHRFKANLRDWVSGVRVIKQIQS